MRVADRPLPPIVLDTVATIAGWPVRPVLAIAGRRDVLEWDTPGLEWDDPDAPLLPEWDEDLVPGFTDATCAWQGLDTEAGNPDEHGNFAAATLVAQLDNAGGEWSRYNVDGTLSTHGPGLEVLLWATDGIEAWWLFAGTIARWDDRADGTVEIEAFDTFSDLAQPIGKYTAGVNGQTLAPRCEAILAAAGRAGIRHRFAAGTATLTAQPTEDPPLEELEAVVASDGGRLYGDADGTLVAAARNWRLGRTDQTVVPVLSDNVCSAPVIVWDPVLSTNDTALADTVILTNVAGLRAQTPATITGSVFTQTDQQWTTQIEGDALAADLLAAQSEARLALDEFDLYVLDTGQPDLWRVAVAVRLFDVLRFLHDSPAVGGINRVDIGVLVASIAHQITPAGWVATIGTTRAQTFAVGQYWDLTALVWDDPSPLAVWGY